VKGAEMRSYKIKRKGLSRVRFGERKCLQHRKGIIKCLVQSQILEAPITDRDAVHAVAILECKDQILSEPSGHGVEIFETDNEGYLC
jgi:hypothetical protein